MTTTARAAILTEAPGPFTVHDVEIGEPGAGEVLVRLVASGLCHTDLGVAVGGIPFPLPGIIGHEGAGVVERVGTGVDDLAPGDRVLLSFTSCGECPSCTGGDPAYCATWAPRNLFGDMRGGDSASYTMGGAPVAAHFFGQSSFASHSVADRRSIVRLDGVSDDDLVTLAPLGCGVLTGFGSVWNVLDPQPGARVAVFGTGAVGMSGLMAAAARQPEVLVAVDIVPERLALATELGATHTVNGADEDVVSRVAEITGGAGLTHAFDTTGNPTVGRQAIDSVGVHGVVCVCGAPPPGTEIPVDIQGILVGKVLRGVTMGAADPQRLIPELVALHRDGRLPLERIERRYSLDDIQQAADDMHHGRTIKPVIAY